MQTDPRSGGVKRSSGVNVHDSVKEAWAEVRDDANTAVDWILIGYDGNSKTDMILVEKGSGGLEAVASKLQDGVPDALETLKQAGIKTWVLTGDKGYFHIKMATASQQPKR